jgi:hypothetical protein
MVEDTAVATVAWPVASNSRPFPRLDSAGKIGNALRTRKIEPAPYGDDQGWRMEGMREPVEPGHSTDGVAGPSRLP